MILHRLGDCRNLWSSWRLFWCELPTKEHQCLKLWIILENNRIPISFVTVQSISVLPWLTSYRIAFAVLFLYLILAHCHLTIHGCERMMTSTEWTDKIWFITPAVWFLCKINTDLQSFRQDHKYLPFPIVPGEWQISFPWAVSTLATHRFLPRFMFIAT